MNSDLNFKKPKCCNSLAGMFKYVHILYTFICGVIWTRICNSWSVREYEIPRNFLYPIWIKVLEYWKPEFNDCLFDWLIDWLIDCYWMPCLRIFHSYRESPFRRMVGLKLIPIIFSLGTHWSRFFYFHSKASASHLSWKLGWRELSIIQMKGINYEMVAIITWSNPL